MPVIATAALASVALWAWQVARSERDHVPVAIWATLLTAAHLADAAVPEAAVTEVAATIVGALGLLGLAIRVFGGRASWVLRVAAPALLVIAHPAVPPAARQVVLAGAWILAAAGSWICVGIAVRRGQQPRIAQLVVMIFAAAAVVRAAFGAGTVQATVSLTAACVAAVAAHAWWSRWAKERARVGPGEEETSDTSGVGSGPVVVRSDDRMGDLVDVAEAIRRRRAREESGRGGVGEG